MKTTVFQIIEKHSRLLKKRENAIKNVEYPYKSNDIVVDYVKELQGINEEIYNFLDTEVEINERIK